LEEIKPLIQAIVAQDKRILANQSVFIGIEEITENGPKIILQVWVKPKDIQPVFYAIQETIYEQFTKNNLLHSV